MLYYDLETLRKAYLAGEACKFLFFWGHTPPADGQIRECCLSQWWMCPFTIDGITYSCAEQYMMAEKARMFHDKAMLEAILSAHSPKEMKAFGRMVKGFQQEIWESSCYALVRKGNMEKFQQNPSLLQFLFGTKPYILVEASPRDRVWGIGMGKQNPDAQNPLKWRGTNLLGFALTETRELLMQNRGESRV